MGCQHREIEPTIRPRRQCRDEADVTGTPKVDIIAVVGSSPSWETRRRRREAAPRGVWRPEQGLTVTRAPSLQSQLAKTPPYRKVPAIAATTTATNVIDDSVAGFAVGLQPQAPRLCQRQWPRRQTGQMPTWWRLQQSRRQARHRQWQQQQQGPWRWQRQRPPTAATAATDAAAVAATTARQGPRQTPRRTQIRRPTTATSAA